jgi:hypothetical protein
MILRTTPTERGVILAESMQLNLYSTVYNTTEIEDMGDRRTITVRSVARPNEKTAASYADFYSSCLRQ